MKVQLSPSTTGFLLASITAVMWGVLPVFLKVLLTNTDAYTITAARFVFAAVFVFVVLVLGGALPKLRQVHKNSWIILVFGTLVLLVNYVTNVIALDYVSPSTVQLVLQIAPFLLMLGGVVFYKEGFSQLQVFGAAMLILGLLLFFNQRIPVIISSPDESLEGVLLVVVSAVAWSAYALTQKKLLLSFTSNQLTLVIYVMGGAFLLPLIDIYSLFTLSEWQWFALIFCCLNTVVGYGAFTKAMHIWDASKVSAVITIAPIFTYLSNKIAISIAPEIFIDAQLGWLAYFGAGMVIAGAMLASIGKRKIHSSSSAASG
ncbi:DMT family transporter [Ningiella sp. W23]|uniref:DMT family transporter n=1 Tax=Ningiella sp. W23 TaxID=3023715 RepID=UPI003756D9B5